MIKFNLYIQHPESRRKKKIECTISYSGDEKSESAHAFDSNDLLIDSLFRPVLTYIGPEGILLSGLEFDGLNKTGQKKYKYQEWYCVYRSIEPSDTNESR